MTQPEEQDVEEFSTFEKVVQIDSDNESTISFGYQPLPQDDDEEEEEEVKEAMQIELDPKDALDAETCDFIKSVMTRIELKEEAIPDWAKTIPESAWMPKIVKK